MLLSLTSNLAVSNFAIVAVLTESRGNSQIRIAWRGLTKGQFTQRHSSSKQHKKINILISFFPLHLILCQGTPLAQFSQEPVDKGDTNAPAEDNSQVQSENEKPAHQTYCPLINKNHFCRHASVSAPQVESISVTPFSLTLPLTTYMFILFINSNT